MDTTLLWTGREYHSLEYCRVCKTETGFLVNSTILGTYEKRIYKVDYSIKTLPGWETVFFEITYTIDGHARSISYEGDGKGNWFSNGNAIPEFAGCTDIDIPLTPFTNSLPINRLNMKKGEIAEIAVIYLDLLAGEIKPVKQQYTCISKTAYHYQNVPNDFEATIQVNEAGFVIDYPTLFELTRSSP